MQLVGVHLEHGDAEAVRDAARPLPLHRRVGGAAPDDGQRVLGAECVEGDAGEIGGIHAAAEADGDGALIAQPADEPVLPSRTGAGRIVAAPVCRTGAAGGAGAVPVSS